MTGAYRGARLNSMRMGKSTSSAYRAPRRRRAVLTSIEHGKGFYRRPDLTYFRCFHQYDTMPCQVVTMEVGPGLDHASLQHVNEDFSENSRRAELALDP